MSELEKKDFPVNIEEIMHTAYMQYSLSVNVGRAIPDVRDGLKPVNRRILYAMRQMGITKSHATVKCAKVVGEVMGNYHPHGDSAIYDALVRLAQPFPCVCPSLRDRVTSEPWTATPPLPAVTQSAAWSVFLTKCSPTSKKKPWI